VYELFFPKKSTKAVQFLTKNNTLSLAYNVAKKTPENCNLLKDKQKAG
jgi:hypothetical protein